MGAHGGRLTFGDTAMKTPVRLLTLAASGLLLMMTTAAHATNYPDGGVKGSDIAADLRAMGQNAVLSEDSSGDPMIRASFALSDTEINYTIFFYGCKNDRCTSIQFFDSFDGDTKKIDEWNSDHRFARAYNDSGKDIRVEYDVDVESGCNTAAVQNAVRRFQAVLVDAVTFMG